MNDHRSATKTLDFETDGGEHCPLALNHVEFVRFQVECERQQQMLRSTSITFERRHRTFVQNALVCGMLVHDRKAIGRLQRRCRC